MHFRDKAAYNVTGRFRLLVWRNGRLVEEMDEKNLVVNASKQPLAQLVGGNVTNTPISQIGFGTNGTAASTSDKALSNPYLKAFDSVSYPASNQVQFNFSLASTEDNGAAIYEFGLLTGGNTLFARKVRSAALNKASDISLTGAWTLTF